MLAPFLLIGLFVLGLAVLPFWPYSKRWGCIPGMLLYVAWVVVFILMIAEVL
jgi:Protein of unknown function (DUF3309)